MRTWLVVTSLIGILSTAVGCAPAAEPSGAEPVGAAQAEPAGNALSASAEESAGSYAEDDGAGFAECVITATEGTADADQDGIPDTAATVTVADCPAEERNGIVNASYSFVDTNVEASAPAQFPFNFDIDGSFQVTMTEGIFSGSVEITKSVTGNQTANSFGATDVASVEAELQEGALKSIASSESYAWDTTYTQSMTSGTFGDGTLVLNGEWNIEFRAEDGDQEYRAYANAAVTTEGLTLSAECPTHIVGGSLSAQYEAGESGGDDGEASIVVTWTGCGVSSATWTAETNGGAPGS